MDSLLKLSDAIKLGHAPTTEKLLKEALDRFASELTQEYELQREHLRYNPSGQTKTFKKERPQQNHHQASIRCRECF